jgi:hypothetical protein
LNNSAIFFYICHQIINQLKFKMKRITLLLIFLVSSVLGSYGQVQIGTGTNELQRAPFEPYFSYSYVQSIYLASEINTTGTISSLQWYYSGTSLLPNSQDLTIYLGHSAKTVFANNTDFEDLNNLTAVFTGGITVAGPGWVTITFDTPFAYNGTDNLIVAVDENLPGFDLSTDDFQNTAVAGNRTIFAYSDSINTDPAAASASTATKGVAAFVPNIIFDGLVQACPNPSLVAVSNVNAAGADFTWQINGSETAWETLVLPSGSAAPSQSTSGTPIAASPVYSALTLDPATTYNFYVRAACGGGLFSGWILGATFTTSCVTVTAFSENFDAGLTIPTCWSKVGTTGSANLQVSAGAPTAPNVLYVFGSATAQPVVSMPAVSNAGAGTHRLKFKARANFTVGGVIEVGYLTDVLDATSFVSLQSFTTTSITVYDTFIANLGTEPGANEVLAFRHTGVPAKSVLIDDVAWELNPTTVPSCATNFVATPNATCGNFATQIAWDAAAGADGYYLTIGSTAGGNDILDAQNIGGVTSYSYVGTFNTTYYYKVLPFNVNGSATGCTEETFTTFVSGCYCTSLPTSNDGIGITNVQIGSTDFPNGDVTYFDNSATPVALAQGINNNVQISFATGYTYGTNIWIDFDNNLTFDATELVFSGMSLNTNPTIFNASFTVPADANLGNHRMRIATADSGQATPNPCYSGSYGVTLDYTVSIESATCTPAAATTQLISDCVNNNFSVDVNVTDLGSGTPSITDGATIWPVTALGIVNVGPFTFGTPTTLILTHGTETICNVSLGIFNYSDCPPANDNLCNAILLTVDADSTGDAFSLVGATAETGETAAACFNSGVNGSVWFSFVAPDSGEVTVTTDIAGGTLTDSEIAVYAASGVTCSDLSTLGVALGCDQDGGTIVNYNSIVNLTALTSGDTYYVQVDRWGSATAGTFGIKVIDANSLSANSFDNKNFTYYPNPVKDILNLSYTKNISNVTVFNLLGQQMSFKTVNANQSKVDMSNLAAGTYMVKVTADNEVKTIKVIKN